MTLITDNHPFAYETERLFRSFFPPIKISLSSDAAQAVGEFCLTSRAFSDEGIKLSVLLCAEGKRISREQTICEAPEKEQERVLSVLLYRVLEEYTGITPPWGILTGVRPVKLLSEMPREEACERLLVTPEKYALAQRISAVQKPIAEALPKRSFSLYVSIPFCPTRCSYCSFVSHSVDKAAGLIKEYLEKLIIELKGTADIARQLSLKLDTVYFGGGTPTTLSEDELSRLFEALGAFDMSGVREFTVEAGRPDTITREKLLAIKSAGARRISVNPQTMRDSVLSAIGRRHSAADAEAAYHLAREIGFDSINMDLIAGLPTDDEEGFRYSLNRVCALSPENITVHSLSLKRAAELFHKQSGALSGEAARMTDYAHETLAAQGYAPYYLYRQKNTADNRENTGYAKSGTESLYNIFVMEELQTVLAVGAGASTKLVDRASGRIERLVNFKYPYEYIGRFDETMRTKQRVFEFFA